VNGLHIQQEDIMPKKKKKRPGKKTKKNKKNRIEGYYCPGDGTIRILREKDKGLSI